MKITEIDDKKKKIESIHHSTFLKQALLMPFLYPSRYFSMNIFVKELIFFKLFSSNFLLLLILI